MAQAAQLKLLAEDADDIAVISAALQDAVAKIGDISFEPKARLLTVSFNRFRWEADGKQRVRTALQVAGVLNLQSRRLRRDRRGGVVELLAITFEPGEAPGGVITLSFAGDADLRAEVECIDAVLADISNPWPTPRKPAHEF
jgi:hypothetical protein